MNPQRSGPAWTCADGWPWRVVVQLPYSSFRLTPEPHASLDCTFTLLPCPYWKFSRMEMDTKMEMLLIGFCRTLEGLHLDHPVLLAVHPCPPIRRSSTSVRSSPEYDMHTASPVGGAALYVVKWCLWIDTETTHLCTSQMALFLFLSISPWFVS